MSVSYKLSEIFATTLRDNRGKRNKVRFRFHVSLKLAKQFFGSLEHSIVHPQKNRIVDVLTSASIRHEVAKTNHFSLIVTYVTTAMFGLVYSKFYYYPIPPRNYSVGGLGEFIYATIPPADSKFLFQYDVNSGDVVVSAPVVKKDHNHVLNYFAASDARVAF